MSQLQRGGDVELDTQQPMQELPCRSFYAEKEEVSFRGRSRPRRTARPPCPGQRLEKIRPSFVSTPPRASSTILGWTPLFPRRLGPLCFPRVWRLACLLVTPRGGESTLATSTMAIVDFLLEAEVKAAEVEEKVKAAEVDDGLRGAQWG